MSQPAALTYEMIQQMIERWEEQPQVQCCPMLVVCRRVRGHYGVIACDPCSEGFRGERVKPSTIKQCRFCKWLDEAEYVCHAPAFAFAARIGVTGQCPEWCSGGLLPEVYVDAS